MKSVTAAKGCDLTTATRTYLHSCLDELTASHSLLADPQVIVGRNGDQFTVTIKGNLPRHGHCESHGDAANIHDAVNIAISRFDARLRKQEDRLHDHHHESIRNLEAKTAAVESEAEADNS